MEISSFWQLYGKAAKTAVGFFWKSGWAFVFGYFISAMIQAFVPKKRLTRYMGEPGVQSISLATIFGAASSSCSFAALAAARSLVQKGAHFIVAVAFMFASTNLVIELGVLILIFLGWQYLAAELAGGVVLIAISSIVIKLTYPEKWMSEARKKVSEEAEEEESFDWRERIRSKEGWYLVGQKFGADWAMVWEEILIGFTVAGFVAVLVPASFWSMIFLTHLEGTLPAWVIALENAAVAPFVAAATFIGSMGNIPLATVLNANGVLFAGIMGFIYSDLMVPPLVQVNAKYYGWKLALYIAGTMFVSIVLTALILNTTFAMAGIVPKSHRAVSDLTRFKLDYTFWMNLAAVAIVLTMLFFQNKYRQLKSDDLDHDMNHGGGISIKRAIAYLFVLILLIGLISFFLRTKIF
ncbi:MAG: permease [Desulfobacterales bacterium]